LHCCTSSSYCSSTTAAAARSAKEAPLVWTLVMRHAAVMAKAIAMALEATLLCSTRSNLWWGRAKQGLSSNELVACHCR